MNTECLPDAKPLPAYDDRIIMRRELRFSRTVVLPNHP